MSQPAAPPQPVDLATESVAGEEDPGAWLEKVPGAAGESAGAGTAAPPAVVPDACRTCAGTGLLNGSACPDCGGSGQMPSGGACSA